MVREGILVEPLMKFDVHNRLIQ